MTSGDTTAGFSEMAWTAVPLEPSQLTKFEDVLTKDQHTISALAIARAGHEYVTGKPDGLTTTILEIPISLPPVVQPAKSLLNGLSIGWCLQRHSIHHFTGSDEWQLSVVSGDLPTPESILRLSPNQKVPILTWQGVGYVSLQPGTIETSYRLGFADPHARTRTEVTIDVNDLRTRHPTLPPKRSSGGRWNISSQM
jgi:hypothetical protein